MRWQSSPTTSRCTSAAGIRTKAKAPPALRWRKSAFASTTRRTAGWSRSTASSTRTRSRPSSTGANRRRARTRASLPSSRVPSPRGARWCCPTGATCWCTSAPPRRLTRKPAMRDVGACRVLLFTPGNRSERFVKAAASGADGVILDLEDAVSLADKDKARATLTDFFSKPQPSFGLRVNNIHTPAGVRDLDALVTSKIAPDFIVLPKVESAFEVRLYTKLLSNIPLVCTIESARGLEAAAQIAAADPTVRALAFGGADLAVDWRPHL